MPGRMTSWQQEHLCQIRVLAVSDNNASGEVVFLWEYVAEGLRDQDIVAGRNEERKMKQSEHKPLPAGPYVALWKSYMKQWQTRKREQSKVRRRRTKKSTSWRTASARVAASTNICSSFSDRLPSRSRRNDCIQVPRCLRKQTRERRILYNWRVFRRRERQRRKPREREKTKKEGEKKQLPLKRLFRITRKHQHR